MSVESRKKKRRSALILLVVLGMLALFSLLAVTYVVFASQSRSTSVAHTRRYVRETPTRPLLEEAAKQLIRGTTNPNSNIWGHDMLADLYGVNETLRLASNLPLPGVLQIRENPGASEIPLLLGGYGSGSDYLPGSFLRIPLTQPTTGIQLPVQDDSLNGRIVTFSEGQGPLGGQSFHIVRYIGDGSSDPNLASSRFSITIDLREGDMSRVHSQPSPLGGGVTVSSPVADWAMLAPAGAFLCYRNAPALNGGYQILLNSVALNGHGIGIGSDGSSQQHRLSPLPSGVAPEIAQVSAALQPRIQALLNTGTLDPPGNFLLGDSDEPVDAADYGTMFLSYKANNAQNSADIIPSFHRAALINYLVNFKPLPQYTEAEFWALLRRIELAVLRPLSIEIRTSNPVPAFMGIAPGSLVYENYPRFSTPSVPTLRMVISGWNSNLLTQNSADSNFPAWLNALVSGPWDVDCNQDGIPDSVWMDIGLPVQRSPDGKLLKALVAYYVDDLDGKIDINAAGGTAQASVEPAGEPPYLYAALSDQGRFNLGPISPNISTRSIDPNAAIPQGMGYGPAELSFRHLLGKPSLFFGAGETPDRAYAELMSERYRPNPLSGSWSPGLDGWDAPSQLHHLRESSQIYDAANRAFLPFHRGDRLPGLPIGTRGRVSLVLDRLGNPYIHNQTDVISPINNEYESRLIAGNHQDSAFTWAEWERIYRASDSDRALLPNRLQRLFHEPELNLASSSLRREVTPRSRHLRIPPLAVQTRQANAQGISSFYQLINTVRRLKDPSLAEININPAVFRQLFPIEFHRGESMNANRPFGNGFDVNQNGEIDEPIELASRTQLAPSATSSTSILPPASQPDLFFGPEVDPLLGSVGFDPIPIPNLTVFGGLESRQLYARHLYCIAQVLVPFDYAFPNIDRVYWSNLVQISRSMGNPDRPTALRRMVEIRSRILAQWAVNVVDFRDADAVMTRFPYDPDPLNVLGGSAGPGWFPNRGADGSLTTGAGQVVNVVWGMEQPELLLTESLAFHDVRVRRDSVEPDRFFDQYRKPEGSLFVELYAPRTTGRGSDQNLPGVPTGLYSTIANEVLLDVGRLTPVVPGFERFPVWRIYLSNPINKFEAQQTYKTPDQRLRLAPPASALQDVTRFDLTHQLPISNVRGDSTFWDNSSAIQQQADLVSRESGLRFDRAINDEQRLLEPDPRASRVVLFANNFTPNLNNTPGVADPRSQVFTNRTSTNANPLFLRGNQYLVVGPRPKTFFGSRITSRSDFSNHPNVHRIELTGNWPTMYRVDGDSYRTAGQNVRDAVTIEAAAAVPQGWAGVPDPPTISRIGLNVSEPLSSDTEYYDRPRRRVNSGNDTNDAETGEPGFADLPADGYHDYVAPGAPPLPPFDNGTRGPLAAWVDPNTGEPRILSEDPNAPGSPAVIAPGTEQDWCVAYLQRLADPEKPWHAALNPYITVDWIPIDLTVFSGEEDDDDLDQPLSFASRQKTGQLTDPLTLQFNPMAFGQTFLTSATDIPRTSTELDNSPNFLKYELAGDQLAANSPRPSQPMGNGAFTTLGFLNSTFVLAAESGIGGLPSVNIPGFNGFVGAPADPLRADPTWFPSTLFWANRSFVNPFEMAYVPICSPGQLGQEFSALAGAGDRYSPAYRNTDPQMPASPFSDNSVQGTPNDQSHYAFSHLINFFQEMPELPGLLPDGRHLKNPSLATMFDWVTTPSPWADVESIEPPSMFAVRPGSDAVAIANNAIFRPFRPPYNAMPKPSEPGRINVNTISEPNVLQSLFAQTLTPAERNTPGSIANIWTEFVQTRRGYDNVDGNFNPHFPTQFAGLFKPVSEAGMVPRTRERDPGSSDLLHPLAEGRGVLDLFSHRNPVQSTLMRSAIQGAAGTGIFQLSGQPAIRSSVVPNATHPHVLNDLYPISRLNNLVTERSNVFAVYITIGFFEYDEFAGIGREHGIDTGQDKRLRAFYVIDRSVPVGYRVGEDLNTENTILIRRMLAQ